MLKKSSKSVIGYMCSYVPHEYIQKLGFTILDFNEPWLDEKRGTTRLPVNMCSYALRCGRIIDNFELDGIILTNCCNSMQRIYDYVRLTKPDIFCYMLELPRRRDGHEDTYFGVNILDLTEKFCQFFSIEPQNIFSLQNKLDDTLVTKTSRREIHVLGNAISNGIQAELKDYFNRYSLTINSCGARNNGDLLLENYLQSAPVTVKKREPIPCARMEYFIDWFSDYLKNNPQISGVVYISSQNCDSFLFDFPVIQKICRAHGIPVIELEESYRAKSSGQFKIRLEAFIECLDFTSEITYTGSCMDASDPNNPFVQRLKLTKAIIPKLPLQAIQKVVANQMEIMTRAIWEEPRKIVWINMVMTPELFYAAGLIPLNTELVAGWLASLNLSREYISRCEAAGLSPSLCSYHKATLGLILAGGLSRPAGAVFSSHLCDGGMGVAQIFKWNYGTDVFILNTPFANNPQNREYLLKQYQDLVLWIENYTGAKLSEAKIKEALILSNQARDYWLKVLELRKGIPVVPGYLMLRNLFGATFLFGSRVGYEVAKTYYEEMRDKYQIAENRTSSGETKRILWIHFAPLYNNGVLEYLEKELGCYIVFDITGYIYWPEYDIEKPLESLVERAISHFYLGEAKERKLLYQRVIEEYKIDGVIHMMHNGCRVIPGASWQVRDIAHECGIPYLELSGDCIDPRGFSEEQMKLRLEAFKETLWRR